MSDTNHSMIKSIYNLPSEIVIVEEVAQRRYYFELVYIKSQSLFKRDTSFNLVIKSCFNFFWSTFLNFNVTHCAFDHGSFLGAYLSEGGLWIHLQDNGVKTFLKEHFLFHSPARGLMFLLKMGHVFKLKWYFVITVRSCTKHMLQEKQSGYKW